MTWNTKNYLKLLNANLKDIINIINIPNKS